MNDTQTNAILACLKSGRTLTPIEALTEFGCFRLGARILDLRQAGYRIVTEIEHNGRKRWARYRLENAQ